MMGPGLESTPSTHLLVADERARCSRRLPLEQKQSRPRADGAFRRINSRFNLFSSPLRRSAALKEWLHLFNRHFILRNALIRHPDWASICKGLLD
jgi:hypothetical protein